MLISSLRIAMRLSRCPGIPGAGCWDGMEVPGGASSGGLCCSGLGLSECIGVLPRKEVIQPHLPVRLPCYDFTPLTLHTFDASAPLRGSAGGFGCRRLGWCDGRCVQGPGTYSPRRADPRLLATPASRRRVAACDPNWGRLLGSAPPRGVATHCAGHCSTCAAQGMRGMMT